MSPVAYDDYVKRPNEEFSYTEEEIKEFAKCYYNPLYFFENYVYIVHGDKGKVLFQPRQFQTELLDKFSKNKFNIILAARQTGKCVFIDTVQQYRDKETGEVFDMSIGDMFNKIKE